jgi:hypothetical protein
MVDLNRYPKANAARESSATGNGDSDLPSAYLAW